MTMDFRRLDPGDGHRLARVAEDVFDHDIDVAHAEHCLSDRNHVVVVAIADGVVVGQIAAILHRRIDAPSELYLDNLGVTPRHRRQGIATRLIALARDIGRELGCDGAWVATEIDNDAAAALYGRTGAVRETVSLFSYEPDG